MPDMQKTNISCRLIAFDLDGTLLDDKKQLAPETLAALHAAGEAGILLVPATGRIPAGLPDALRGMPGLRWGVLINGARLYDFQEERAVEHTEIPVETAVRVIDYLNTLGVLYDCYQNDWGYIDRLFYEHAAEYVNDPGILDLLVRLRTPVDSLRETLIARGESVQKLQLHTKDAALRLRLLDDLTRRYPELSVSSSVPTNIELNIAAANKGDALLRLCRRLAIPPEQTVAFGDGTNDLSLLRAAGLGVAMANAEPEVRAAADRVTASNEDCGVAKVIREILNGG